MKRTVFIIMIYDRTMLKIDLIVATFVNFGAHVREKSQLVTIQLLQSADYLAKSKKNSITHSLHSYLLN